MISFNDIVHEYQIKNEATSNIKIQQLPSSIELDIAGIYFRDGPFLSDVGIVTLHPSKGTHWVCYINETYFDSCGSSPPQTLSKFSIKRNG